MCPDAQTLWLRGLYHTDWVGEGELGEQQSSSALLTFSVVRGRM